MWIERAQGDPRLLDSPPRPKASFYHSPRSHDPIMGEEGRNVSQGDMGGDKHHSKRITVRNRGIGLGRQHHRDVDVPGQMGKPLGMSWVRKAGEVEGMLLGWGGDDRVGFAGKGELGRGLDGVAGNPACPNGALPVGRRIAGAETPAADRDLPLGPERRDLVVGSYQRDIGVQWLFERPGGNLGTDPTRISQRDRQSGPRSPSRRSRPSRLSRLSVQDLIST